MRTPTSWVIMVVKNQGMMYEVFFSERYFTSFGQVMKKLDISNSDFQYTILGA